ncbi:hypothetical protein DKX38_020564 [Salix brachista]|uniref:Uncharacterized protein n=1 Tax=Salix brachista TaxID=2182728 RepID=A0A5N5KDB4_9ROSI|nr:hypothetical protein DKX38_020564 [Salix brachista]
MCLEMRRARWVGHKGDFDKGDQFHSCRRDQTCLGIEGPTAKARQVFVVIQAVLREAAKTSETDDSVLKMKLKRNM